ncbi:MAG: HD domain-containing protein [archaeon]|nr:MAG: HD domain-containing protein [archaeon]
MEDLIEFLHRVGELKHLKRAGWIMWGVKDPESVAEHSFRVTLMALILSEKMGFDKDKCVKMAIVHDLSEILAGDMTPYDEISEGGKHEKEEEAIKKLTEKLHDKEILELWNEYEERKTPEAKFVYEADKLEMLLQAYEYEKEQKVDLQDFWEMHKEKIKNPELRKILKSLLEKRK